MTAQQALDLALRNHRANRLAEAESLYRQVIAQEPDNADALHFLGVIAHQMGHNDLAIELIGKAIRLKPDWPQALNNLGAVLKDGGRVDEAIAACRQAIVLKSDYANAWNNLGSASAEAGHVDEAIDAYRRAIALKPGIAEAHTNLASSLLLRGKFAAGWEENEWRWRMKGFLSTFPDLSQSHWDGSVLPGGTIALHAEQGFGDTLQFVRYVPLVAKRCGQVIVSCQPELHRLLRTMPGARWIALGEPLPPADAHCLMLSLPSVLGTTLETIPNTVPYLQADGADISRWRQRLKFTHPPFARSPDRSLNVGLAWAGRPTHRNDRNRTLPLAALAPLARAPDVRLVSLQFGEASQQAKNPPAGMELLDWTADLHDFADTAALIANLDLVISVDTAVVHLAGAMGKPVWTMLPFLPDWRWLLEREDSPWYPTMRIFRQRTPGDWAGVVERVATVCAERQAIDSALR